MKWSDQEVQQLQLRYEHTRPAELVQFLPGRTPDAIKLKAAKLGLKQSRFNLKRADGIGRLLDGSLQSWYWLGMMLADGCIRSNGVIILSQSAKDAHRVDALASYTDTTDWVYGVDQTTNFGRTTGRRLQLKHIDHAAALSSLLMINGAKTVSPPPLWRYKISRDQWIALIVGFVDGDGTVIHNHPTWRRGAVVIKCHSSWTDNLQLMTDLLYREVGAPCGPKVNLSEGYARATWSRGDVMDLLREFIHLHRLDVNPCKWVTA